MEKITLSFPQMLNEKQAAHILAVSIAALRRWRREGRGPRFTHVERCVRYDLRAIERFLAENSSDHESKSTAQQAGECTSEQQPTDSGRNICAAEDQP
jgi:helix-turn-helix protein